jgi:hypothetical protein
MEIDATLVVKTILSPKQMCEIAVEACRKAAGWNKNTYVDLDLNLVKQDGYDYTSHKAEFKTTIIGNATQLDVSTQLVINNLKLILIDK